MIFPVKYNGSYYYLWQEFVERNVSQCDRKYDTKYDTYLRIKNRKVDAKIMELPELVLYPDIVSYFGQLDAEIGFDIMVY